VAEDNSGAPAVRTVPALPRRLAEPTPVVLAGTALWFAGLVAFGIAGWMAGTMSIQFWTSLTGCVLGIVGFGIFRWQRSASRRGARGAWRGLAGLDD
jgi:membrane associated rhomboid family serine protease